MLLSLSSIKGTAMSRHSPFTELTRPASTFAGKNSGAFRFDSGKRKRLHRGSCRSTTTQPGAAHVTQNAGVTMDAPAVAPRPASFARRADRGSSGTCAASTGTTGTTRNRPPRLPRPRRSRWRPRSTTPLLMQQQHRKQQEQRPGQRDPKHVVTVREPAPTIWSSVHDHPPANKSDNEIDPIYASPTDTAT